MGIRFSIPIVPIIIWVEVNFLGKTILPEILCLFLITLFILGAVAMKKFMLTIFFFFVFCFHVNAERVSDQLIVLYDFTEKDGVSITDSSGVVPLLNLDITEPAKVQWLDPGLRVLEATVIKTAVSRSKLNFDGNISIEAWIKPLNNTQEGPARIVTFSKDSANRNFTFGQQADYWDQRLRTSDNPGNGSSPSLRTPATSIATTPVLQHVVYTRSANGDAKFYIDKLLVQSAAIPGDFSNWDITYDFGLFNELNYPTDDRTWLGDIFLVAVYLDVLTPAEIAQNFDEGITIPEPPASLQIILPDTKEYGKIKGGDETHADKVEYLIPYEVRGNYILSYEVWDAEENEIKILVNDEEVQTVPVTANEVWSNTQKLKILDVKLCDDNLKNVITFDNTLNPPGTGTHWWGVRNVELKLDKLISDVTIYTIPTSEDITIEWDYDDSDPPDPDINFDFYVWNRGEEKKYLIGNTQQKEATVKLPRTGLYVFYARSCDSPKGEEDRSCSSWGNSIMVLADGTLLGKIKDPNNPEEYIPGNWLIYGHIAAPTGGGID
jgi:hypothetical protein